MIRRRVELVNRPNPGFGFDRLVEIVNFGRATAAELSAMTGMEGLAAGPRAWAGRTLP